ncbi:hypothetical protein [Lacinutrix sp. MedPE-SW]|uniref:hypothetical protein n=1 Tax=Lacinutrix sp. MedPE-SW TaxID=1860087 RepID=UPI0009112218|nr:hypothetical protein [Lacinutrix sp. MedPE-SW]OIQ17366.1 MAG: hypothetical protein BM549_12825 [Lacinutrix sp. MedPE-SW]
MFKKQFLLTRKNYPLIHGFIKKPIGGFYLQFHKNCVFTTARNSFCEVIILGELFSYTTPELTNQNILNQLIEQENLERFQAEISNYYGQYVVIYKSNTQFSVFNDACGQAEIYYTKNFENYASQVKLLQYILPLQQTDETYYTSKEFNKLRLFINNSTPFKQVKKLLPNHAIDIIAKTCSRFFPIKKLEQGDYKAVAVEVANMLKGYLKAISLRHKICLPITAGYDSRVLFLASLDLDCEYFVTQFKNMPDTHNDLVISKQLAAIYNKPFKVIKDVEMQPKDFDLNYSASLDFPLYLSPDLVDDKVIINGNISEIGRNGFYYCIKPNAKNLNVINFFKPHTFIQNEYKKWLDNNKAVLKKYKYHILDIFLWEQFMGIVHAKAKSQNKQLGVNVMTPYNSRVLLNTLLSVDRGKRDRMDNVLYNEIIAYLSKNNTKVLNLSINPSKEKSKYLKLKKFGLHKVYSTIKVKLKS